MEAKGKIEDKKSDNKAFRIGSSDWYNCDANSMAQLKTFNKGDEVIVTFEKKGVIRYATNIVAPSKVSVPEKKVEPPNKDPEKKYCACGKEIKNKEYDKCWECNQKNPPSEKGNTFYKSNYGSPEDIAGKEVGCALGAAATVASSIAFSDVTAAVLFVTDLADRLLEWIKAKKLV